MWLCSCRDNYVHTYVCIADSLVPSTMALYQTKTILSYDPYIITIGGYKLAICR